MNHITVGQFACTRNAKLTEDGTKRIRHLDTAEGLFRNSFADDYVASAFSNFLDGRENGFLPRRLRYSHVVIFVSTNCRVSERGQCFY